MPEGTVMHERPIPSVAPPETIGPPFSLDDIRGEQHSEPIVNHSPLEMSDGDVVTSTDLPSQVDQVSEDPNVNNLRQSVLRGLGMSDERHLEDFNINSSHADITEHHKTGIRSKIGEFFKGGSKLSKLVKVGALPIFLVMSMLMKAMNGSKGSQH